MEDVPPSLVLNWDHTAMKIVSSSNWTMEKKEPKGWKCYTNGHQVLSLTQQPAYNIHYNY